MAKRRRRTKRGMDSGEVEMTAMIDVVFQLLIYFIVTIKPVDVVAHLDVYRPSPDPNQKEQLEKPPKMIRIEVFADGFRINERSVGIREMEVLLDRLASIDTNQTIMIMATALSEHKDLIKVLDLCSKSGLQNLSVISTN